MAKKDVQLRAQVKVLDHGFVEVLDVMGDDADVLEAARISTGGAPSKGAAKDAALIDYLMRNKHTSPFEMCLDGDTRIQTYPCPSAVVKHYKISDIANAFLAGSHGSWARLVYIRSVNPETGMVERTKIKRAWKTGTMPCYRVTVGVLERSIVATSNHPFLCEDGVYRQLSDLQVGDTVQMNGVPALQQETISAIVSMRKTGKTLEDIADLFGVSSTTVLKYAREAGLHFRSKRKTGFLKKEIGKHKDPNAIARSRVKNSLCFFCKQEGRDIHHIDKNPHNNKNSNLVRLCPKHHRHIHTHGLLNKTISAKISSIEYVGERNVYDLEVFSENHNFVAEGFVVHNCEIKLRVKLPIFVARQWIRHRTANVNEMSGRYTKLPSEYFVPEADAVRAQSQANNQGRDEELPEDVVKAFVDWCKYSNDDAFTVYENYLDAGLSRELARINLPLSTYTAWVWKIDLHNLLHFLQLRTDGHAQTEIQEYAAAIRDVVRVWVPLTYASWCRRVRADALAGKVLWEDKDIFVVAKALDHFLESGFARTHGNAAFACASAIQSALRKIVVS